MNGVEKRIEEAQNKVKVLKKVEELKQQKRQGYILTEKEVDEKQILWKPAKHNPTTSRLLEKTQKLIQSKIEKLLDEVNPEAANSEASKNE